MAGQSKSSSSSSSSSSSGASSSEPAAPKPVPVQAAAGRKFRRVYSVSFPNTAKRNARKPCEFQKEEFAVLLKKLHDELFANQAPRGASEIASEPNQLEITMVFKERHADGNEHIYAIVQCSRPYSINVIHSCLQYKHKIFCSIHTDHYYFWTAVVYSSVPSVKKALEEMDSDPYHSDGLTLREVLATFPKGARKADKDRVRSFLGLPDLDKKPSKANPVLTQEELSERILNEGWRKVDDVTEAARAERDENATLYNTILRMNRKNLRDKIDWIWDMEGATDVPEVDRVAKLLAVADSAVCTCGGKWKAAADKLLDWQGIDSMTFRALVVRALRLGRAKTVNVLIYGEPDAGKSFLFKVLPLIFDTFITRGQNESFPLQGIHGKEICVLQDVRYESFGLPWDDWLRWGEGESLMIRLPRNQFEESLSYTGSAPLFATMATMFSYPLGEAKKAGRSIDLENTQWRSRWTMVRMPHAIPEEHRDPTLRPCRSCGAQWYACAAEVTTSEARTAASPDEPVEPLLPELVATPCTPPPSPKRRCVEQQQDDAWSKLQQLMGWYSEGLLSAPQFESAKSSLGL
jgi:hypothetical protein